MNEGQWLGGYRLIERRGIGGAGAVWLAEDEGGMQVALKLLHPAVAQNEQSRERLVREMRTVNAVQSGGVAHVLDIEVDDVQPFIVSEYIDGPTLSEVLADGPLKSNEAIEYADAIRRVIDSVHAAGVIHRDIKPGNIILSAAGPVLIDFGIAQAADDLTLTATGFVSGTASYASPEILRGTRGDENSDWWAWAASFLQMLTGRPPFGRGSTEAVMNRVLTGVPDTGGLPAPVAELFRSILHPQLQQRLTPEAFLDSLREPVIWAQPPANTQNESALETQLLAAGGQAPHSQNAPTAVFIPPTQPVQQYAPAPTVAQTRLMPTHNSGIAQVATNGQPVANTQPWEASFQQGNYYLGQAADPTILPPGEAPTGGTEYYPTEAPGATPFLTLTILAALGMMPIFLGANGVHWLLGLLVAIGLIGGLSRAVRLRRLRVAGTRTSDWWVVLLRSPLIALKVVLMQGIGLLVGCLVAAAVTFALLQRAPEWVGGSFYVSPEQILNTLYLSEGSPAVVEVTTNLYVALGMWGIIVGALAVMCALPTGRYFRGGISVTSRKILPMLWGRALVTVMLWGAIAITWWMPVKSLVFWY